MLDMLGSTYLWLQSVSIRWWAAEKKSSQSSPTPKQLWAFVATIAVILFLILAFLTPIHGLLFPPQKIPITVQTGYANATYESNFQAYTNTDKPYLMPNLSSTSSIYLDNGQTSHFRVSFCNMSTFYIQGTIVSTGLIGINGAMVKGLVPSTMSFTLGANGTSSQSSTSPYFVISERYGHTNLSAFHAIGNQVYTYSNSTTSVSFQNITTTSSLYNFSYHLYFEINFEYHSNNSVTFSFETSINGLSQKVSDFFQLTFVEEASWSV